MEELKLDYSIKRRLKLLLIYLLVAGFCSRALIIMFNTGSFRIINGIILFAAGVFSLLIILVLLFQIFSKNKIGLIVNSVGINSKLNGGDYVGLIKWENIEDIYSYQEGRNNYLAIQVKDTSLYKLHGRKDRLLRERKIALLISPGEFNIDLQELSKLVNDFFRFYNSNSDRA